MTRMRHRRLHLFTTRHLAVALLTGAILLSAASITRAQFVRVLSTGKSYLPPQRADSLFLTGHYDAALKELDHTLSTSDTVTAAQLYNRGLIEKVLGKGNGLTWFKRAYEAQSDNYLTPWSLGEALTDLGRLEEAEPYLRKAVSLDKGYYESSVTLGRNLRLQGRPEEAVKAIQKAFGRDRTYVKAYTEMAKAYEALGNRGSARAILLEGYQKFPYEEILTALVRFYQQDHKSDSVVRFAREYLRYYPKGPHLEQMLTALKADDPDSAYAVDGTYLDIAYPDGKPYADPEKVIPEGKHLAYDVRWGPIGIGDLAVDVRDGVYEGEPCWRIRYIASSAPGLPFVTIADTFLAYVDRDVRFTYRLDMYYHEQSYHAIKTYVSDYKTGYYEARNYLGDGYWQFIIHPLPPNAFDATSQLWFAQQLVLARRGGLATVELSGGFEKTIINYRGPDETMSLGDKDWKTIKIDGIMRYAGIAGLTGDFQGWYAADDQAWPLMAKFKIFLGWVKIRFAKSEPTSMPPGPDFKHPIGSSSLRADVTRK